MMCGHRNLLPALLGRLCQLIYHQVSVPARNPVVLKAILIHFLSWGHGAVWAALCRDFTALQASKKGPALVKGYEAALGNVRRILPYRNAAETF